ncbi:hypothetical protein [Streptomyces arenae]|uniref:hypothetical protein n=1 Tax=Streptomyces arenae TaxID=29301 RepID=UPI002658E3D1|nr:hypothetical protein [Streptomyces arenae]MCG7204092.1 hypothetical protein [Streptomyces arenae]
MSSGPAYGRPRPGSVRLRALVPLLLALLLTGAPTAVLAATAPTAASSSAGTAEHDVLDTPLRPAGRAVHRADVPQRPAPLPATGPTDPADRDRRPACSAAARPPYATPLLRTVVLRC